MSKISLTGEVRIKNGVPIVRKIIVPKNKYSEIYKFHEKRIKEGVKDYTITKE